MKLPKATLIARKPIAVAVAINLLEQLEDSEPDDDYAESA